MIDNINKPTSPKWGKVAVACAALSGFIGTYAAVAGNPIVGYIGLALGSIGVVFPILMPPAKEETK